MYKDIILKITQQEKLIKKLIELFALELRINQLKGDLHENGKRN